MAIKAYTRAPAGSPHGLFDASISLEIPPFQRPYVWNKDRHWVPLWEDMLNLADAFLDATNDGATGLAEGSEPTHFLGAVVLHRWSGDVGAIPVYRVIDGQQRLTTLQLLLHAAKEAYEERDLGQSDLLSDLVLNDPKKTKGDTQRELKIVPTRRNRTEFLHAMQRDPAVNPQGDSLIVDAHQYFREGVGEWLDGDLDAVASRAEALYIALSHLVQVVVIELDHNADPQVIFETLNARGEPLRQSDLVKNYIIHVAEQQDHNPETVADNWLARYDDDWWTTEVSQGRVRRQRIEQFVNYWLVMREAAEVPAGEVFRTFQDQVRSSESPILETVSAMNASSKHYRDIVNPPSTSAIAEQLDQLRILEAGVVTPVILWLMANVSPDQSAVVKRAMQALASYYVRRVLCGRTTAGLNRLMHEVLDQLNEADGVPADQVVIGYLRGQTADRREWPSDHQVIAALIERRIYSLARRKLTMILATLARDIATPKSEPFDYSSLTVEHVMPQKWHGESWSTPPNDFAHDGETAEAARDRIIHTIGNLTLVTQSLNSAVSNDPWAEKRSEIERHSILPMNHDLIEHAGDVWNEAAILARGRRLAERAIQIWPGPDAI